MKTALALSGALLAVVGIVGFASLNASALNGAADGTGMHYGNGRQASLEWRANVLGMTAEELQTQLQTKTMSQVAKEQGLTQEEFQAKMQAAAEQRWKEMGLSSDEIAERVAAREQRHAENSADHEWGSGEGNHRGGFGYRR